MKKKKQKRPGSCKTVKSQQTPRIEARQNPANTNREFNKNEKEFQAVLLNWNAGCTCNSCRRFRKEIFKMFTKFITSTKSGKQLIQNLKKSPYGKGRKIQ